VKYDYSSDGRGAFKLNADDKAKLGKAVALALEGWAPGKASAVTGVVTLGGRPYMAAAGPISLSDERTIDPNRHPRWALVYLEALDGTWVEKLSKTFGFVDMRIADVGPDAVPLPDAFHVQKPIALVWTPADLGGRFLTDVLPMSLAALGFAAIIFVVATLAWIRIARDLSRALDLAKAGNAAKSEFLALMSHEIRTPLNGVLGMTNLLLDGPLGADERRGLLTIRESGESLMRIINDVLDFSKLEAGRMDIEIAPFDLHQMVRYAAEICAPRASAKGVVLEVNIADDVPQFVRGDSGRTRQVVLNFLTNAIKFTPDGRVALNVRLTASDRGPAMLRIEVIDTGIGIAADKLPTLFQRFSQADASISRRFGGTGLGLAISKKLVELMNGQIGAASEPGRGSTFWFELPLCEAVPETVVTQTSSERAASALDEIRARGRGVRLLLVEDNATNQLVAKSVLKNFGITPDLAGDGLEAVAAVRCHDYDVVLMDIHMPEMDGIEATRAIRSLAGERAEVPIVALTANAFDSDVERCLAAGMNGHVGKPFHKDELIVAIAAALKGRPTIAHAPEAPVSAPDVDLAALDRFRSEYGEDAFRLLIDTYLADSAARLARLRELLASGTASEEAVRIAHSLKSASAMAGANAMSKRAAKLEAVLHTRDRVPEPAEAEELRRLFAAYRGALAAKGFVAAA
jgi:signal transduction histidine kinase/CheY-like chemotaxis protein/HPt (histidine-containing phosphotransfer) domain-containing protein